MHLKVVGTEKLIYEEDIYGLKADAVDGEIVFLDKHADYLSILKKGNITIFKKDLDSKENLELKEDSILFIENNKALLFS